MSDRGRPTYHREVRASTTSTERARGLRHAMTLPEALLWRQLKGRRLGGLRFRRQHPLGPFIADFYCHDAALVVEIDGGMHAGEQLEHDDRRDAWMRERRLGVVRVRAVDVLKDMHAVMRTIEAEARARLEKRAGSEPPPSASPTPPPSATGED